MLNRLCVVFALARAKKRHTIKAKYHAAAGESVLSESPKFMRGETHMADQVTKDIIVNANIDDVYAIWADFEQFPRFMTYIKSITKTGARTSHWVMEGPLGKDLEWDAETTTLEPNKRIAWNSRDGGDIKTSGQVTFNELAQDQTEITVLLQYVPPAGKIGEFVAQLFSDPAKRLDEDLRNFKAYAEATHSQTKTA